MQDQRATFYAAATPRPGAEGAFRRAVERLAGQEKIDGVQFDVLEIAGTSAALRGHIRRAECPQAPEALATYLEDQLAAREGIQLNLDVTLV
jgi:hypothetical protein